MMLSRAFLRLAVVAMVTLIGPARADVIFPTIGDRGDHQEGDHEEPSTRCLVGSYLVGLTVRSGAWIDSVTPKCAHFKPDGSIQTLITIDTRGGNGGGPFTQPDQCAAGSLVHGLRFTFTDNNRQVKKFILECRPYKGGDTTEVAIGVAGGESSADQICPLHQVVVGLNINWGQHVNGVGTMCDTEPVPTFPTKADLRQIGACQTYARTAVSQGAQVQATSCNIHGSPAGRWSTNYQGHFDWCMSMTAGNQLPAHETDARSTFLQQRCASPPPNLSAFLPACTFSVILRNNSCENLDGSPSTILSPGSLSATGCGGTDANALANAKQSFAAQAAISDQPAPGACTYTAQHTQGCLCR